MAQPRIPPLMHWRTQPRFAHDLEEETARDVGPLRIEAGEQDGLPTAVLGTENDHLARLLPLVHRVGANRARQASGLARARRSSLHCSPTRIPSRRCLPPDLVVEAGTSTCATLPTQGLAGSPEAAVLSGDERVDRIGRQMPARHWGRVVGAAGARTRPPASARSRRSSGTPSAVIRAATPRDARRDVLDRPADWSLAFSAPPRRPK